MQLTARTYLLVCPLVFLAGFIDSIAGGGGLISLPAYYLAGLPPALAAGTNKTGAVMGTAVAAGRYAREGRMPWKTAVAALLGSFPGSYLGAWLLTVLPADAVRVGMLAALPVIAAIVLFKKEALSPRARIPERFSLAACGAIGFLVGAYDGLVGPGTGTFLQLLFVTLIGLEALSASGAARLVNLGSNIGALVRFVGQGNVLYALALPAAVFGMAGNYLGSTLALKHGAGLIRKLLLIVLVFLMIALARELIA